MKYKLPHKRRKEKKTDYKLRLSLLKSGNYRLVVRKSNNYILGQIIKYEKDGDKTIISVHSKILKNFGWKNHCGNLPAAYLTGFVLGKKAKDKKIDKAILDIGLQTSTKGNRIYALLKGALDAGLQINHSKGVIPSDERLMGKHISENMVKDFETVKNKIMK